MMQRRGVHEGFFLEAFMRSTLCSSRVRDAILTTCVIHWCIDTDAWLCSTIPTSTYLCVYLHVYVHLPACIHVEWHTCLDVLCDWLAAHVFRRVGVNFRFWLFIIRQEGWMNKSFCWFWVSAIVHVFYSTFKLMNHQFVINESFRAVQTSLKWDTAAWLWCSISHVLTMSSITGVGYRTHVDVCTCMYMFMCTYVEFEQKNGESEDTVRIFFFFQIYFPPMQMGRT